jgi:vacuolar protein sorting-associated protein 54
MSFKQPQQQQKYQQDIDTQRSQSHDEENEQRVPLQAQQQQSIAQVTESGPSSHGLSSPASVDQKISSSITNGNGTIPTSSSNNGDSASNAIGNSRLTYDPCIQALPLSQRKQARDAALQEAETVLYALQQQRDHPFFYHSNGYNTPHYNGNGRISSKKVGSGFRNKNGNFLDNFNLLGVVTSPTLLLEQNTTANIGKSSHPRVPTSHDDSMQFGGSSGGESQPRRTSTSTFPTTSATSASASNSFFLDPSFFSSVSAMSTTLSKEIESLNSTLSSYSKTYLGSMSLPSYYFSSDTAAGSLDFETELNSIASQVLLRSTNHSIYPYVFGEDIIKGQIPEDHLPKEIVDLDLSNVEAYLAKCGSLAEQLNLRDVSPLAGETNDENDRLDQKFDKINTVDDNNDNGDENDMEDPTHFVPDIFFSPDFDLTDPNVFSSLLVVSKEREDGDSLGEEGGGGEQDGMEDLGGLIRLQDPFEFTRYLDAVELALLHQVRSKSSSFFRETNRFTELKSLIASSVEEVMALRNDLQKIRERSIADAEMIPIMDKRRKDTKLLKELLDEVEYVVQVKSSIGEMIQNRNYLEAVERIHLARSLLNGDCVATVDGKRRGKYALRKITALSKMHDQLAQYENLVVSSCLSIEQMYFIEMQGTYL